MRWPAARSVSTPKAPRRRPRRCICVPITWAPAWSVMPAAMSGNMPAGCRCWRCWPVCSYWRGAGRDAWKVSRIASKLVKSIAGMGFAPPPLLRFLRPARLAHHHRIYARAGSAFLGAIGARGQPGPLLERAVKGRGLGETELLGDVLDRQVVAAQVIDRQVAAQVILQFLKARAFLAQMTAQGLRTHVQLLGNRFQIRPGAAIAAEQAADLADQAVATIRAGKQIGR